MDTNFQAIMDVKLDHLRKNLELRRFQVSIVEDAAGAVRLVKDTIAPGSSVGLGGSMTLKKVYWHWILAQIPRWQLMPTIKTQA